MPLSYAVSEAEKLVRVSATGIVNSDDLPLMTSSLVTDTTHVYALAQVFAAFVPASTPTVKFFRTCGEAGAWLKSQSKGLPS